jgi:hypothetical protein
MTPKDRALFQASIDFCTGQDPHKTWRRDDFIDYVVNTSGVSNLITVGTMTAPLRYHGVIEQVSPGWWRTVKDAPTLTPEVFEAYWKLPASERSHETALPTPKPQPTCGVCGLQHLGEC